MRKNFQESVIRIETGKWDCELARAVYESLFPKNSRKTLQISKKEIKKK